MADVLKLYQTSIQELLNTLEALEAVCWGWTHSAQLYKIIKVVADGEFFLGSFVRVKWYRKIAGKKYGMWSVSIL